MMRYRLQAQTMFQVSHKPTLYAYLRMGNKKAYLINITQHHNLASIRSIITSRCNIPLEYQILYINTHKITPYEQLDELSLSPQCIIHVIDHRLTNKKYLNIYVKYNRVYKFQVLSHSNLYEFVRNQLFDQIMIDPKEVLLVQSGRQINLNNSFYQENIEDNSQIICIDLKQFFNSIQYPITHNTNTPKTQIYNQHHQYHLQTPNFKKKNIIPQIDQLKIPNKQQNIYRCQYSTPSNQQYQYDSLEQRYLHSNQQNMIEQVNDNCEGRIKLTFTKSIQDNTFIEQKSQNQPINHNQYLQTNTEHQNLTKNQVYQYISSIQLGILNQLRSKQQQGKSQFYNSEQLIIGSIITHIIIYSQYQYNNNHKLPQSTQKQNNSYKNDSQQKIVQPISIIQLPIYKSFQILSGVELQQTNKFLKDLTTNSIQRYVNELKSIQSNQDQQNINYYNKSSISSNYIQSNQQNQGIYKIVLDSIEIMNQEVVKILGEQQQQKIKQTIFINNKSNLSQGTQQNATFLSYSGKFPSNGQQSQQFGKDTINSFGQQSGDNNQLTKSNLIKRSFSFQNKSQPKIESDDNLLGIQSQQYSDMKAKTIQDNLDKGDNKNKENLINKGNEGQNEY